MTAPVTSFANRYQLEREIARGGMAEVYLARDELLDRPVAVKVLSAEYARDPSFVERFRREAQSAASLNHPDIVAIYDWGQEQGTYFIVMEYVAGHTLRDLLRLEGSLSPQRSANIAAEIASALDYAHRAGVVHRDVKPGNVLINSDGVAKVTDFGIARADTSEALTQTGSVMGTATYFSPEQAQGYSVDGRSDVYSLGIVLYEMLCGAPPFRGDSPVAVAYQHVREEPPRPTEQRPDLPPDLETIILACLAKDPDARYQSAHELREDLLRFLRGRAPLAAPLTAAVATSAGAETVANVAVADDGTALVDAAPRRRKRRWWVFLLVLALLGGGVGLIWYLSSLGGTTTETFEVPDVLELSEAEAVAELEGLGFDVAIERQLTIFAEEGAVFDQDPGAGEMLREGSTVTIFVSEGLGQVEITDVSGRPVEEATELLEGLDLEVRQREEESETFEAGIVIRTEPPAGTEIDKLETVTLVVSRGAGELEIPDVTGRNRNDAVGILSGEGFVVQQTTEPSDTVGNDLVIRTVPPAGSLAQRGSSVNVIVSSGPPTGEVPSVLGLTQADAEAAISAAGFVPSAQPVESSPENDGLVVNQNPTGGTTAQAGIEVVIQVGQAPPSTTTTTAAP